MSLLTSISGEQQLWSSVNDWFTANVPAAGVFTYFFDQALDPATMPGVYLSSFNGFEPGTTALGDEVFPQNADQNHTQGRFNTAYLEINIYTDGSLATDALKVGRQIKDAMVYALQHAGMFNEASQSVPLPPIVVYDSSNVSTNTFARPMVEADNWLIKNFYKPSAPESQIFRWQLIAKLQWVELT